MWAARFGDVDRVRSLLLAGANRSARDSKGMTAIDYAKARTGDAAAGIISAIEESHGGDEASSGG